MQMAYEFEAYVRKSIRNAAINYGKVKERRSSREVSMNECEQHLIHTDVYFAHFDVFNTAVLIADMELAFALSDLDDDIRLIVLAYYFLGLNDADIAQLIERPRRTVNTMRRKGLKLLRGELSCE